MNMSFRAIFAITVGTLFTVACGTVSGTESRDSVALEDGLQIYLESGDCIDTDGNYLPDSMEDFLERSKGSDWIVSATWDNDCNYAEGAESSNWKIAYIK